MPTEFFLQTLFLQEARGTPEQFGHVLGVDHNFAFVTE